MLNGQFLSGAARRGTGALRRQGEFASGEVIVDLILVRLLFIVVVSVTCYVIAPFGLSRELDAGVGALVGAGIVVFEWKLRGVSLKRLIGAAIGSILGICGAYLFALVIRNSVPDGHTQSFLQILVMLLMAYVGLIVGANKGDLLNLAALGGIFGGEKQGKKSYKILDTSVIIDGRIADIRDRIPRWRHRHAAVRSPRTPTRRRLRRLAQAQSRTPRPRHPPAPAKSRQPANSDRRR